MLSILNKMLSSGVTANFGRHVFAALDGHEFERRLEDALLLLRGLHLFLAFEFDSNCQALGGLVVRVEFKCFVSAPFSIENDAETFENDAETIENGAETKHLHSTRTARPPKGPGSSSRIQMLKSSRE